MPQDNLNRTTLDGQGSTVVAGSVLQGFGLSNAGRFATVVEVSKSTRGRALIERHLDGKRLWTFLRYWRKAEA